MRCKEPSRSAMVYNMDIRESMELYDEVGWMLAGIRSSNA